MKGGDNMNVSDLLASLPPAYRVERVYVDGDSKETTNFVTVNNGLAYFIEGNDIKVFNVDSIDGLKF